MVERLLHMQEALGPDSPNGFASFLIPNTQTPVW